MREAAHEGNPNILFKFSGRFQSLARLHFGSGRDVLVFGAALQRVLSLSGRSVGALPQEQAVLPERLTWGIDEENGPLRWFFVVKRPLSTRASEMCGVANVIEHEIQGTL